jgi:predicted nucleic acid-binding protein
VTLVIDASIAAKWILPEPESDRAEALRNHEPVLIAPELIVAELGNAIWKRARRQEIPAAKAVEAISQAIRMIDRLYPLEGLAVRATAIAISLNHPIYDCFYLALAEREQLKIATADDRLANLARVLGTVEAVRL